MSIKNDDLSINLFKLDYNIHVLLIWSYMEGMWVMVFNAIFNNISVISWRSVLLVEETGVPGENHWPAASHWKTWNFIT
jgi:hypothetical protein